VSGGPPRTARDLRLLPGAAGAWVAAGVLVAMPEAAAVVAVTGWLLVLLLVLPLVVVALRRRAVRRRRSRDAPIGHEEIRRAEVRHGAVRHGPVRRRAAGVDGSPARAGPGAASSRASGALAAIAFCLGCLALVSTSLALRADVRAPPALAQQHGVVEVALVVTEEAGAGDERVRGTASAVGSAHGEMPILVVGARLDDDVGIGTALRLRGVVSATAPGGGLVAIVIGDGAPAAVTAGPPDWLSWGNAMRARFRELAGALPGDGAALLTGLAIGDDRGVPATLADAMRTSSLTHLTAVSGANCAIVVGAVMIGGALLGVRRRWRIAGALAVLAAFVILVTPQPSVVRAAVMAVFALVGLALARPMRGLPLLSVAILGILVVDPWAARELGFVLSALATAGLLVLSAPLGRLIALAMPYRLALAIAVPLSAQIMCQPAIAVIDAAVPTYGVVANLLAVPAAPLATVAGLLACLSAAVLPPLAVGLAWLAWLPASWIGGVATTAAALPAARLPWPEGPVGVGLYTVLAVAIALVALGRGRTRLAGALATGVVIAGFAGASATAQLAALTRPTDWQLAMCDVGQGDASLVRSAGRVALIDTGPDPEPLAACLADLGIGRIDLLVLTHFDRDHVGGIEAILGRVDRVLTGPPDASAEERVLAPLRAAGAAVEQVARGDAGTLGALAWQVLWPRAEPDIEPGNDASVVVRFTPAGDGCPAGGCLSSVLLGDLGEAAQVRLLATGPLGRSDVVKVSHHGSADQSERLYRAIAAPIALVGVGAGNDYGHPTPRLLAMLAATGATVGRTDADGLLLVARGPAGIELWQER